MCYINLHTHSSFSDGTLSPSSLLQKALLNKIKYFSLTDHDTVSGSKLLSAEIKKIDLKFITGIEISTIDHDNLHILGYGIDLSNENFLNKLADYRKRRIKRIEKIFKKLNELGVDIDISELDITGDNTFGRPHVSDLMKKKGYAKSRKDAFQRYLANGQKAYVPPLGPSAKEAIEAIKEAKGYAFLAHPYAVDGFYEFKQYKDWGLDGIEAFYPLHTKARIEKYIKIAQEFSLFISAGTDFHGPGTDRDNISGYKYEERYFKWIEKICA